MSYYLGNPWLRRAERFSAKICLLGQPLSFYSLNIQLPPLRHSSASLRGVTASLKSSWEVFTSSKETWFNIPLFLLSITMLATLLRGCWDLLFVKTALKQQCSVITRWFRRKPHAQINDSDLIWTRRLRPLVKVSLFCWGLVQAQRTQTSSVGVNPNPSSSACSHM